MSRWCYFVVLLLLVAGSKSVPVDQYDDFEHDVINHDRDEEPSLAPSPLAVTRTTLTMSSLQCFFCSSLDDVTCFTPDKTKANVTTCATEGSMCFTTTTKNTTEVVVKRGCRDKCVVDNRTACCEGDFCNSLVVKEIVQPMTKVQLRSARRFNQQKNKSDKALPQTVLFFVTVLLLLQTVVKVAFV